MAIPSSMKEALSRAEVKAQYGNFIGGKLVPPVKGQYFDNVSPITGQVICSMARSTAEDVEKALDAAHAAAPKWGKTSTTERANILNKIADRLEAQLEKFALLETLDNGKPFRDALATLRKKRTFWLVSFAAAGSASSAICASSASGIASVAKTTPSARKHSTSRSSVGLARSLSHQASAR